jgi:hypothetical protein
MRLLLTGLLLWQQVACQSKKDFGKSVLHCGCPSPTIFEKIKSPKSSFFGFPNSKIRFPPINSTKPNFGVSQGLEGKKTPLPNLKAGKRNSATT